MPVIITNKFVLGYAVPLHPAQIVYPSIELATLITRNRTPSSL